MAQPVPHQLPSFSQFVACVETGTPLPSELMAADEKTNAIVVSNLIPLTFYFVQPAHFQNGRNDRSTKILVMDPSGNICDACGETETPQWRAGCERYSTLCNACGITYKKVTRGNPDIHWDPTKIPTIVQRADRIKRQNAKNLRD